MEAVGQDMDQEPADELVRFEPHDLHALPGFDPVILPAEGHAVGISTDQAVVGDGDAVRVSSIIRARSGLIFSCVI